MLVDGGSRQRRDVPGISWRDVPGIGRNISKYWWKFFEVLEDRIQMTTTGSKINLMLVDKGKVMADGHAGC